jgi:hypothetical protein
MDQWMTPPNVLELARGCMGSIDMDTASNPAAQEYVQAKLFCVDPTISFDYLKNESMLHDGLQQMRCGNVWCNPPYSRGNVDQFVDKAILEKDNVGNMLFLVNSATDTEWYHKLLQSSSAVCLWRGRMKFWKIIDDKAYEKWEDEKSKSEGRNKAGNNPRCLNSLFYFGKNVDRFHYWFGDKGTILERSIKKAS